MLKFHWFSINTVTPYRPSKATTASCHPCFIDKWSFCFRFPVDRSPLSTLNLSQWYDRLTEWPCNLTVVFHPAWVEAYLSTGDGQRGFYIPSAPRPSSPAELRASGSSSSVGMAMPWAMANRMRSVCLYVVACYQQQGDRKGRGKGRQLLLVTTPERRGARSVRRQVLRSWWPGASIHPFVPFIIPLIMDGVTCIDGSQALSVAGWWVEGYP